MNGNEIYYCSDRFSSKDLEYLAAQNKSSSFPSNVFSKIKFCKVDIVAKDDEQVKCREQGRRI